MPTGEAVARLLGEKPLTADEIETSKVGWSGETPLWYYVLRETDVRFDGDRLDPVGGHSVSEVLSGLLGLDPSSVATPPAV